MDSYSKHLAVRWSDLDPNFHVRHSVYYDFGAFSRISFLEETGLTAAYMTQHNFGPVLFREECLFRREIKLGDRLTIDLQLIKASEDLSRWSIRHRIIKDEDTTAAILTVDGAWIDTIKRKLANPPEQVKEVFLNMPRDEQFEWIIRG